MRRALVIPLLCLVPVLVACGTGGKKDAGAASSHQRLTGKTGSRGACKQVAAPPPKTQVSAKKPKRELDQKKQWKLVVATNCGTFTIALDVDNAPRTAASLVSLARSGFYDGTTFHRVVPGFVIQGGDPTGTGRSGPGYTTTDKPPAEARYTRGVVAMAKTPTEAPGTAGSQFFVVTGNDTGLLPEYALVGRVVSGLDVVQRIGKLGDPRTERPAQPVVILHVAVRKG